MWSPCRYTVFFSKVEDKHVMTKFPYSWKTASIDYNDVSDFASTGRNGVHPRQGRRYSRHTINGDLSSCAENDSARKTKYRVELPRFPFRETAKEATKTTLSFPQVKLHQIIDANHKAYFEQMPLLPCVLGEFRGHGAVAGEASKIVGHPEHITIDVGSVREFAAEAETAFGTILLGVYRLLGWRHYGHPDMMNNSYIMQQGGAPTRTKTMTVPEVIFTGIDFAFRGGGNIQHDEYFYLFKGCDLCFKSSDLVLLKDFIRN